jgi:hypothetical protein
MGILRDSSSAASYPTLDPFEISDDAMVESATAQTISKTSTACVSDQSRRGKVRSTSVKETLQQKVCAVPVKISSSKKARVLRRYVSLCLLVAGFVAVLVKVKPWVYFSQPNLVFAYFEVRALDGNGRPIAGAVVNNAGKRVGTTDSFGEWRRYMQVPLGATIPISLTKKTPNTVLFVSKNFAVPPTKQEKNEIELRSSVQLMPVDSKDIDREESSQTQESFHMAAGQTSPSSLLMAQQSIAGSVTSDVSQHDQVRKDAGTVSHAAQPGAAALLSDLDSIWFSASDVLTEKELIPALTQRAKELGLRVAKEAAWQIKLSNLIDKPSKMAKDGGGLILVGSQILNSPQPQAVEFLRNYQLDARTTARGILFGLVNHVNKNILLTQTQGRWVALLPKSSPQIWRLSQNQAVYVSEKVVKLGAQAYADETFQGFYLKDQKDSPCALSAKNCFAHTPSFLKVPPVVGWRRFKLTVPSLGKDSIKVFVSGYPAKALGDNVFEYWGLENVKANATILQNSRVILRGAVSASSSGAAIFGTQSLSRR